MLFVLPHGYCQWICAGCPNPVPSQVKIRGDRRSITGDDLVDFHMRNASLAEAAQLLVSGTYAEIFVPASRINERRDLHLESVPLATVLRELGLTAVEPTK